MAHFGGPFLFCDEVCVVTVFQYIGSDHWVFDDIQTSRCSPLSDFNEKLDVVICLPEKRKYHCLP